MRDAAIEGRRPAPRRRDGKAPPRAAASGLPSRIAASAFDLFRRHPGRVLGALACLGMGGTIVGNAVLFQSGRHPAPLFGRPSVTPHGTTTPLDAGSRSAAVRLPPPRAIAPTSSIVRQIDLPPPARRSDADPAAALPKTNAGTPPPQGIAAKAPAVRHADAITKLLSGTDKTPVGTAEADARVLAAQHALAKLGFPVKPDGRMGTSTRQALDKFAQDHHLAVGADLTPKMLRDLANAAAQPRG